MKRLLRCKGWMIVLMMLMLPVICSAAFAEGDDLYVEYDFTAMTAEQVQEAWEVVYENKPNWEVSPDLGLVITSEEGALFSGENNLKNLFLRDCPDDWVIDMHVVMPQLLDQNFQQSGIIVYTNDDNFLKFVYAYDMQPVLQLAYETRGAFMSPFKVPLNVNEIWLRLVKNGRTYTAYYSIDGEDGIYRELGACSLNMKNYQVGFAAYNGNAGADSVDFSIMSYAVKDPAALTQSSKTYPLQNSDFTSMTAAQVMDAWQIKRETPGMWRVDPDKGLVLSSQAGALINQENNLRNLFLQQTEGDWVFETKINLDEDISEDWQQGGIVVYGNDDNFFKFVYVVNNGVNCLQLAYEDSNGFNSPMAMEMVTREIWMRVQKEGDTYTAYYTVEDPYLGFQSFGSQEVKIENPMVGIAAFNGGSAASSVDFAFEYTSVIDQAAMENAALDCFVTLDQAELRLNPGQSVQLTATVTSQKEQHEAVSFTSSDPNVLIVDENGVVTAVGEGYATVTAKVAYGMPASCAVAVVPEQLLVHTAQGNPFLPIWEHAADGGEPRIFEDPDNPGQYRVYMHTSEDIKQTHYCGYAVILWSAPVDDLTQWTYHGPVFKSTVQGVRDTIYAPDICEVIAEDGTKTYYLYPNNQSAGRRSMVAKSSRPDGPFYVCNWEEGSVTKTVGPLGFDVAVLLDDDGRAYGYWGLENNEDSSWAELDPNTMATLKEGTEPQLNLPTRAVIARADYDPTKYNIYQDENVHMWGFFEAPSIRKLGNKYVLIFSRRGLEAEPTGCNTWQLAYGYSDSPEGPWKWGGIIVDAGGETVPNIVGGYARTFPADNTHGSIVEVNGDWYIFYNRANNKYSRQATIEKIDVVEWDEKPVSEGGQVRISTVETTSNGVYVNGLEPYAKYPASIVSYLTNSARIEAVYDRYAEVDPVVITKTQTVAGVKYFNLDTNAPEGEQTYLSVTVVPSGKDVTIDVFLRPTTAVNTAVQRKAGKISSVGEGSILAGTFTLTKDMPTEPVTLTIPLPQVDELDGKWGLFFTFTAKGAGNLCELHTFEMTTQPVTQD